MSSLVGVRLELEALRLKDPPHLTSLRHTAHNLCKLTNSIKASSLKWKTFLEDFIRLSLRLRFLFAFNNHAMPCDAS